MHSGQRVVGLLTLGRRVVCSLYPGDFWDDETAALLGARAVVVATPRVPQLFSVRLRVRQLHTR